MPGDETLLSKALELCTYINMISASMAEGIRTQEKLVLSFDLYCLLLEYTAYVKSLSDERPQTVEELIACDDLLFEALDRQLEVRIDFFLPPNSVMIS